MSLTTTSRNFKKSSKWLGIVIALYYIFTLIIWPGIKNIYFTLFFDREPPNPIYGMLDPLVFEQTEVTGVAKTTYVLNTKNGSLPQGLPKKMPVYKFKPLQYSYLAGQRVQEEAVILGYGQNELISDLKAKEFKWRSLLSGGTLTIDTETKNIVASTNLTGKSDSFPAGELNPLRAKTEANILLSKLGRYKKETFDTFEYNVQLGTFRNGVVFDTTATSEAQVARVDITRMVNKYKILGPNPKKSLLSITLRAPQGNAYDYPFINLTYQEVSGNIEATYPIINVQEAWKQVSIGKGVITELTPKGYNSFSKTISVKIDRILVTNIYLAYYETPVFQKYLQPIYVFEGVYQSGGAEGGTATIYYPAITKEYVKDATTQQSTSSSGTTN